MYKKLLSAIVSDLRANPRDYRAWLVLVPFRIAQATRNARGLLRPVALLVQYADRVWSEVVMGVELRPKTSVGTGLTLYHGTGLVVNDHATIGSNVVLRNGVVIGNRTPGGPCPVIEDGVVFGAHAMVLGAVSIGAGATIGAGAVVLQSVPAGRTAVGNPARILPPATPFRAAE
jgi:putative colanic acid biosynthesis acetyltransferase WcaB